MNHSNRIATLDALRGIAVLGILLMNILWFGMPEKAVEDLGVRGEYSGPNYWAWWMIEGLMHGTMRGVFSMLFGASAVLIIEQYARRSDFGNAAEYYGRRLLVLFLFGLFNAYILLWSGDILYTYALAGMFIFPLHRLPVKRIFLIAIAVMFLFSLLTTWHLHKPIRLKAAADAALAVDTTATPLSRPQQSDLESWNSFRKSQSLEHKRQVDAEQVARTQGGFTDFFMYSAGVTYFLETEFVYDFFFIDAFTFMLIGIGLYRIGVITGKRSSRFYLLLCLVGYALGLPVYYWFAAAKVESGFDPYLFAVRIPYFLHPFGRLALTLGNIGFLNLLFRIPVTSWLLRLMQPLGRMAFTNYLMQSIIGTLLFGGFAFGMFNKLQRYELYYVVLCIWAFQIIFSHLWMRYFTIGPFEWLWRSAAHGRWQKFERQVDTV